MILINSPEYEGKLRYIFYAGRLTAPDGLSTNGDILFFNKVNNATNYLIYVDDEEYADVTLSGTGRSDWLFNELITIEDNINITYNVSFTSNDTAYSSIRILGHKDNLETHEVINKYSIYYDNTLVFEETEGTASLWKEQSYRFISFSATPENELYDFLVASAVGQPEQLSVDLSLQANWNNLTNGSHTIQLVAKALHKRDSVPSVKINFGKNVEWVKGNIYGPYTVKRVVDGDTVVATINGADMKIRMIGVDTPESVANASTGKTNCQEGIDASNYTKTQLTNLPVYIEFDDDIYDKYNRYLCYIYRDQAGTQMYNAELISEGYGEAKYYSPNGAHRTYLETCMTTADTNNVNFWGTGFFPTKLRAPVISLTNSDLTWDYSKYVKYVDFYDIRSNAASVYTYLPEQTGHELLDLSTVSSLSIGQNKIKVRALPINSAHTESNLSNQVIYTIEK